MKQVKNFEKFEEDVKSLYESFGFKVYKDVLIDANQIDLIAELQKAGVLYRNMIECKAYSENVGIQELNIFIGRFLTAKQNKKADKGIFVTTTGFTRDAKEAAANAGIDLFIYSDLLKELQNFEPLAEKMVTDWHSSKEYSYYVEPFGKLDGQNEESPLIDIINLKLNSKKGEVIALLGEYGSGKSIFLQKLAADFAAKYLSSKYHDKIPIFIKLRELQYFRDIKDLIKHTISQQGIEVSKNNIFDEMLRNGKFLLLLDGLDEITPDVDEDVIIEQLSRLNEIMIEGSNVIITSRSNFFQGKQRAKMILQDLERTSLEKSASPRKSFAVVWLQDFSDTQISDFLKNRIPKDANDCFKMLKETYNLEDLAKRPILLDIISNMMPEIKKLKGEVNAAKLYEIYTNLWIDREKKERNTSLSKKIKRQFCHEVSWHLFIHSLLEISFSVLTKKIKDVVSRIEGSDEISGAILFDAQVCSFMEVGENKTLHFAHRSFSEFFCAQKLCNEINNNDLSSYRLKCLTPEIQFFLLDYIGKHDCKKMFLNWAANQDDFDLKGKALWSMNILGINIKDYNLENANFSHTRFEGFVFEGLNLSNCNFHGSNLNGAKFINCNLNNCVFHNANLENSDFSSSYGEQIDFSNAKLNETNFLNTNFHKCNLKNSILSNAELTHCDLRDSNLQRAVFYQTDIQNADLRGTKIIKIDIVSKCKNWESAEWDKANLSRLNEAKKRYS
ncbi:MAG: pentapeptide repeat-containing protein [Paludibacter sp.]|nr:pentapeptide repeat-containing protein [Paludibacter sp.]